MKEFLYVGPYRSRLPIDDLRNNSFRALWSSLGLSSRVVNAALAEAMAARKNEGLKRQLECLNVRERRPSSPKGLKTLQKSDFSDVLV